MDQNGPEIVEKLVKDGWTTAEISKNEGVALGSVKTKLRSCLKTLKAKLSTDFE